VFRGKVGRQIETFALQRFSKRSIRQHAEKPPPEQEAEMLKAEAEGWSVLTSAICRSQYFCKSL
jgi:hypothetical protein